MLHFLAFAQRTPTQYANCGYWVSRCGFNGWIRWLGRCWSPWWCFRGCPAGCRCGWGSSRGGSSIQRVGYVPGGEGCDLWRSPGGHRTYILLTAHLVTQIVAVVGIVAPEMQGNAYVRGGAAELIRLAGILGIGLVVCVLGNVVALVLHVDPVGRRTSDRNTNTIYFTRLCCSSFSVFF